MAQQSSQLAAEEQASNAVEVAEVRLDVRHAGRSTAYHVDHIDFLMGTVPGCDLRVPGADLPPLLCLLTRAPRGATLRKLAPTQVVLVNGQTANHTELHDGDRITVGALDIFVHITASAPHATSPSKKELAEEIRQFRAQVIRFQEEKEAFAAEQKKWNELRAAGRGVTAEPVPNGDSAAVDAESGRAELHRQRGELAAQRRELADIRKQLYDRYQERRDRLTAMQASVEQAAKKVQERKRFVDEEAREAQRRRAELDARQTELEARTKELAQVVVRLDEERNVLQESKGEVRSDVEAKLVDLQTREAKLAEDRVDLDARLRRYQADVLRLDRRQGELEQREKENAVRQGEIEAEWHRIKEDSATLEEEATRLDEVRVELEKETQRLALERKEQDAQGVQLAQRAALLEGQQATLAALRTRLERGREEVRRQEQHLAEERARQDEVMQRLDRESQALSLLKAELEKEQTLQDQERQNLAQRSGTLEAAVGQLKTTQEQFAGQESTLEQRRLELEGRAAALEMREAEVQFRLDQASQTQERLDQERQALRERTLALTEAEQAREALQEQLRKRAEDLANRQKAVTEKIAAYETLLAGFEAQKAELVHSQENGRRELDQRLQEMDARAVTLADDETAVANARHELQRQHQDLDEQRRLLAEDRQRLQQERLTWDQEQADAGQEFDRLKRQAGELVQQLPDLELRAGAAVDRLSHAREQLRDHLQEVHAYVRQGQQELENTRQRLRDHAGELEKREQALRHQQDEQRLSLAAFRQQLIGWQGQIADLKRALAHGETRLERKQAQVEKKEKRIDQASQELARQVEHVQEQEKAVGERRQEIDRHLIDMREWYRRKLRDLAGLAIDTVPAHADHAAGEQDQADNDSILPTGRHILSFSDAIQPGDERLGNLLREHNLIEARTLTALLAEGRRQRRSLRQVLLSSGVVTLYQLALIEAGNMAGLMIGPVRIIDRLRITPHETAYRVFDPRNNREAVLRHLSEEDAAIPVRAEEFHQRFTQLLAGDSHWAGTWEVLEVQGRPAVLQEWLIGLPASDWPPLAAAPGVCYRLLTQATLGLAATHRQGLVHGHLDETSLILTAEGTIKICGLGEPAWLRGGNPEEGSPIEDLRALGRIAASWCTPIGVRKGAKTKPLPPTLVAILGRLTGELQAPYGNAQELLNDLDQAGGEIPANAEAWDRLLKHVRDHAAPEASLRLSA